MVRGRKPVPTHLRVLRGNPGQRRLHPEIEPDIAADIPEPPEFLMPVAKDEWRRIVVELHRLGLLTLVDERPFAAYCQAYGRWVAAEKLIARMAADEPLTGGLMIENTRGTAITNPLVVIAKHAASDMVKYAAEFGFTPSARARVAAGAEAARPKFAGLIGGRESNAERKAARRAGYQVHRNPDSAERKGTGEAVQAGGVSEGVDQGHLRAASQRPPGGAPSDPVHWSEEWEDRPDRGLGLGASDRAGSDPER
jgi:P27 family predicted phage terminase small subunit